jgi:hypothetical protein
MELREKLRMSLKDGWEVESKMKDSCKKCKFNLKGYCVYCGKSWPITL